MSGSAMNIFEGRVRWVLIFWILAISAVSFLDRVNISIAGPSIEREFHLDHIQLGWVFSAWVVGYALFQVRLADRFGPRRILFLGNSMVGPVHCAYGAGSRNIRGFRGGLGYSPLLVGRGRVHRVPSQQPSGGCVDPFAGTWSGERVDFCGRGTGVGSNTAFHRLHHLPLRLAMVAVGMRLDRIDDRRLLVLHRS